ncbi:MAG TPA: NADH-quinone oxidoreductase subunit NuoK [Thermoguttaceae bacterium]
MSPEVALLNNYLIVGALLFGIGLIGFISRRNLIVMFLAAEMMLQGVSLSLAAWSRFHNNFGGQILVIFIIAIAACEAAIVLALVMALFQRRGQLDVSDWQTLREENQPAFRDQPLPEEAELQESWPHLAPAGIEPEVPLERTNYRPTV